MTSDYHKDLARWMPLLVKVWRSRGGKVQKKPRYEEEDEDDGSLTPHETKQVAQGVRTLSLGLTRDRQLAGAKYMDDPALLGAYLLFYWPVSYAQARQALGELPRPREVLDLGSGPGPMSFAALDAGAAAVTSADRSKAALDLAKALATEATEPIATREWSPERPLPDGQFDLVLMGHVINELFHDGKDVTASVLDKRAALLEQVLAKVKPRGSLLILEPALRDTSRALLQLRDRMVSRGYAVRAPCLFRGNCPALVKESDWCHAERDWKMPPTVEAIARLAGIHKDSLKMSYLALAPKGEPWAEPPEGHLYRIVSEPLEGKGRLRFMGCGPEGRVGLAMQEKHQTEANKVFFKLPRGAVVKLDVTEPRGDGLALDDRSTVQVLAWPGQPLPPGQK
jgi:SAM-dependent methyltransferase